jgi:hypothetical protein
VGIARLREIEIEEREQCQGVLNQMLKGGEIL